MSAHNATDVAVPGWQQRLDALVAQRMRTPFRWGQHDCCLFAADAVLAITGQDHAGHLRGAYSTEAQAQALLAQLGGLRALAAKAGPSVPPLQATAGCIGLVVSGGHDMLAVCTGPHWVAPAARGLTVLPFNAATAAWQP